MKPLTDRDLETLNEIVGCTEALKRRMDHAYAETVGFAPIEFGGSNGSHHGKTATKLVSHGFVDHKMRGHDWGDVKTNDARGSKVYRATAAGVAAIEAWRKLKRTQQSPYTRKWGHTIPNTQHLRATPEEIAEWRRVCHLDMPV